MKKIVCIFFAMLFAFSAMGMTAFAEDTESDDSFALYHEEIKSTGDVWIAIGLGETVTMNYLGSYNGGKNKPVPKGGHIEWYVSNCGGEVQCAVSGDKKTCRVTGAESGVCNVNIYVFDASGQTISHAYQTFRVQYSGFLEVLDTLAAHGFSFAEQVIAFFLQMIGVNKPVKVG